MIHVGALDYRRIELPRDADVVVAHYLDAMAATFGHHRRFSGRQRHLQWIRSKIEEFPDGFVLVYLAEQCVGQLQLQVPYGLTTGYVNLFYVSPDFRRQGFGRQLHLYADRYFRSWEATEVQLHVSPTNVAAVAFYRALGYRRLDGDGVDDSLWTMGLELK